jgi:phospholipase/carboxylesterase
MHDPAAPKGLMPLGIGPRRDGHLYIPKAYRADRAAPMIVLLHGAGGNSEHGLAPLINFAEEAGMILLAPDSRAPTWDLIMGKSDGALGPDVTFIDQALEQVFEQYAVDPNQLAIGGFSDGASYALSLGLANGELFQDIIAFSPGFMTPPSQMGAPRIFVSHGIQDSVLPIASCSRRIVPALKKAGYDVTYIEFEGAHTVPLEIAHQAKDWFLARARKRVAS